MGQPRNNLKHMFANGPFHSDMHQNHAENTFSNHLQDSLVFEMVSADLGFFLCPESVQSKNEGRHGKTEGSRFRISTAFARLACTKDICMAEIAWMCVERHVSPRASSLEPLPCRQ